MGVIQFLACDTPLEDAGDAADADDMYDFRITNTGRPGLHDKFTKKRCVSSLEWVYSERRAAQLIDYIKRQMHTAEEIELWDVWDNDDFSRTVIQKCRLEALSVAVVREVFGLGVYARDRTCFKCVKVI